MPDTDETQHPEGHWRNAVVPPSLKLPHPSTNEIVRRCLMPVRAKLSRLFSCLLPCRSGVPAGASPRRCLPFPRATAPSSSPSPLSFAFSSSFPGCCDWRGRDAEPNALDTSSDTVSDACACQAVTPFFLLVALLLLLLFFRSLPTRFFPRRATERESCACAKHSESHLKWEYELLRRRVGVACRSLRVPVSCCDLQYLGSVYDVLRSGVLLRV
ncbi:hypothetical protein DQ04_00051120 [Trypanosoma grayi]|uniref:hypothetical protein n=1 Tax=Trypanosoma grayi TaxID=71804 RepID=UPI0004F43CB8|nr:hypothetical protein DQ04_00051120 [Trypanosoma grayi]KEG15517.1 hypothetical protein DQ04_00051120 [Trypanosoma grayi]